MQILNKDKTVLAMKLLEDNSGIKMGKTEGNMVSFLDSPTEMFGKVMSWNDSLIEKGFELCTEVPDFKVGPEANPRDLKMHLAREIVKVYHGERKAREAEESFISTFQKKEIPNEMEELYVVKGELLGDLLVKNKVVESKSEWRRLVLGKAVHDLEKKENITDPNLKISKNLILKIGKKRFLKIKLN